MSDNEEEEMPLAPADDDSEDDTPPSSTVEDDDDTDSGNEHSRQPFDVQLPRIHQYLRLSGADELTYEQKREAARTVITVSILEIPIVLLPTQILPFHSSTPHIVQQLREAARTDTFIALRPDFHGNTSEIATLVQIGSIQERQDGGVAVQATGRQRCRILNRRSAVNGMPYGDVLVLDEYELPSFSSTVKPASFARLRTTNIKNFRLFSSLTAHSAVALKYSLTKNLMNILVQWLLGWFVAEKVQLVVAKGPTEFSYWVAANIPIDVETRIDLLEEPCTDRRLSKECTEIRRIDAVVCRNCDLELCKMSQMISLSTDGSSAHYVNPGGYVHDLFTVSEVTSTVARGSPSAEYSWFPGYMWTIHECARCLHHVGWRFTSSTLLPRSFFGLTRNSVRPANSSRSRTFSPQLF